MLGEELQGAERHLPDGDVSCSAHGALGVQAGHGPHRWVPVMSAMPRTHATILHGSLAAQNWWMQQQIWQVWKGLGAATMAGQGMLKLRCRFLHRSLPRFWCVEADRRVCTGVCDDDVNQICQKASVNPAKNRGIWSIGAVGRCLSRQLAENKKLTPGCQTLVAVAAPKVVLLSPFWQLCRGSWCNFHRAVASQGPHLQICSVSGWGGEGVSPV